MSTVRRAVEVAVPIHAAYEQLARFESYPQFMTGVQEVKALGNNTTHWVMDLGGERREFDAQITENAADERVCWKALDGPQLAESITLKPIAANRTQVIVDLEADVKALMPSDSHGQQTLSKQLKMDLDQFKNFVEGGAMGAGAAS